MQGYDIIYGLETKLIYAIIKAIESRSYIVFLFGGGGGGGGVIARLAFSHHAGTS